VKNFTAYISFLIPVFGVVAPLGLAPLLIFAALVHIFQVRWRVGTWPRVGGLTLLVLIVFTVWTAASLAWTPDPQNAAIKLLRLLVLIALGLAFISCIRTSANERVVSIALVTGLMLSICFVFIEKFAGAPLYRAFVGDLPTDDWNLFNNRFNRGMTVICLVVWPATRALGRLYAPANIALLLATLSLCAYMNSAAALFAFLFGAMGYALVWFIPGRQFVTLLGGLIATAILLMPAAIEQIPIDTKTPLIGTSLPKSGYHRLLIWDFTNKRIDERPVSGWGFYSSRSIPGGTGFTEGRLPALPLHPHNAALQWRLELGLPGAILGSVLVFLLISASRNYSNRADRAAAAATAITTLTIAILSYGIWQSWWVAALIFSAACMHSVSNADGRPHSSAGN
tara:strand:- start:668 stop:1858 length:1191 start_codon:yes stop_codon:yes gene_type:complete